MAIKTYRLTLDVRDSTSQAMLSARKGDRGRVLEVRFADGGSPFTLPDGCYAAFNAVRTDGAVIVGDCAVIDDTVVYVLDGALAGADGRVDCDVTLYDKDDAVITSPRFGITVYAGVTSSEEIEGTDEYRTLGELVTEAREIQDENKDIAEELEELKDGIAVELEEANKTIEGFNEWYGQTSAELSRLSGELNAAVEDARELTETTETRTDQLISNTSKICEDLVNGTEKLCEELKADVETSMAEFTSVGKLVTVPASAWKNDTDIDHNIRTTRVACRSTGNGNTMILSSASVTDEWTEFSGTFVYDNTDGNALVLRFYGGPNAVFVQPYDIADVRVSLASDSSRTNLLPSDIADLGWMMDSSNPDNKLTVSYENGLKYIHVFRQTNNNVTAAAMTKVQLVSGYTYNFSCLMRFNCKMYTATVPLDGIRAHSSTTITPCVSSAETTADCKVRAFGQRIGELFFTCDKVPDKDIEYGVTATTGEGGIILNCAAANAVSGGGSKIGTGSYTGNGFGTMDYECRVEAPNDYEREITALDVYETYIERVELPFAPSGMLIMTQGKMYSLAQGGTVTRKIELIGVHLTSGTIYVAEGVSAVVPVARLTGKYLEFVSTSSLSCPIDGVNKGESYTVKLDGETVKTSGSIDLKNELNSSYVKYQYIIW